MAPVRDGDLEENEVNSVIAASLPMKLRRDPNVMRFIQAFVSCRHLRQAADVAGIPYDLAKTLYRRNDVQATIEGLTSRSLMKFGYSAEEIIERVKEVVDVDPREVENLDGTVKRLRDMPPELSRAVKKMRVKETFETDPNGMRVWSGYIVDIEFWDKMVAAKMLGNEKSVMGEKKKIEHDIGGNMSQVLLERVKRGESETAVIMEREVGDE